MCNEFPECWHLVWQAEDRCRRDEMERIRRQLTRARLAGTLPMDIAFDPDQPWIGVFTYAARDGEYWAKHVVRPAQSFLARGGAGKSMTREAAEGVLMDKDTYKMTQPSSPAPGEGRSRNARKRRAEKQRHEETNKWSGYGGKSGWGNGSSSTWSSRPASKGGGPKANNNVHPRKFGHHHPRRR